MKWILLTRGLDSLECGKVDLLIAAQPKMGFVGWMIVAAGLS
jgi:hypothetical protein